jgi:hypothetical protein
MPFLFKETCRKNILFGFGPKPPLNAVNAFLTLMSDERYKFMNLQRWPARLTVEEVAWVLNCQTHDIQGLVRARLLKPLGNPPSNGKKLYDTKAVLACAEDPGWLCKMTNAIHKNWRRNNEIKKETEGSSNSQLAA